MSSTVTKSKSAPQQLTEQITDWHTEALIVDAAQHVVRNIALTGLHSKNGYRYSQDALQDALPLYENRPVFLDHAANKAQPYHRSTRDLVGTVMNPRYEQDRILADIQVLDTEAGRTFLALVESNLPAVGMSQVVIAERKADSQSGQLVVVRIQEVVSLDAVMFPATTSNLQEQSACDYAPQPGSLEHFLAEFDQQLNGHVIKKLNQPLAEIQRLALFAEVVLIRVQQSENNTIYALNWCLLEEQILQFADQLEQIPETELAEQNFSFALRPFDHFNSVKQIEEQNQNLLTEIEQLRGNRDALIAELTEYHSQQAQQAEIDNLLRDAELPEYAITTLFREMLHQADSTSTRKKIIAERARILREHCQQLPFSRARLNANQLAHTDEAMISAIKQQVRSVLARST